MAGVRTQGSAFACGVCCDEGTFFDNASPRCSYGEDWDETGADVAKQLSDSVSSTCEALQC